jgi:hypothetical protein
MLRTRTRARRSATTTILPRSARPSLRTGRATATMLARPSPTTITIPITSASIRRDTAPHTLSPGAGAESVHHHVRLADGAAGSAAAEAGVTCRQPWTARGCEGIFESSGEVPVWLDAVLGWGGAVVSRGELRRAGLRLVWRTSWCSLDGIASVADIASRPRRGSRGVGARGAECAIDAKGGVGFVVDLRDAD